MPTYLDAIVKRRRDDLAVRKRALPLAEVMARAKARPPAKDFAAALARPGLRIIAEFKKASPSKGGIAPNADPVAVARGYAEAGAAAISVLTEEPHFKGSLDHVAAIKEALGDSCPPVLRKDFIVERYQVHEARAFGADAILLIVAILTDAELRELLALSADVGLQCLVEVHDEDEAARAVTAQARVIGINNRDLHSFVTDIETTHRVRPAMPQGCVVVSESGVKTAGDVATLSAWGVDALLIGEAFMTSPDPGARLREFLARD